MQPETIEVNWAVIVFHLVGVKTIITVNELNDSVLAVPDRGVVLLRQIF